ncbi:kinase-like protein [Lepidopterella palustris CBS 459.81]|uniref:ethanolamine kinase n=1 Tax=Lepidopterella palustris CBS 459.81 TaxID=1314670 RepID=A0A8E2EFG5_9PEZI|nr:kinase-like protein [Lepidopterella palustris CBS 459.81]
MESSPHKPESIRYLPLSYDNADSENTAFQLIFALRPEWRESASTIEFIRFTDGITNTLLKAVNKEPGLSERQIDREAILLRAYGKGTDVLIDRERETLAHSLLARHGLAPPLLARFDNGLLYKFIEGSVCSPADLRRPEVWRAVAKQLGEWHATLPISSISSESPVHGSIVNGSVNGSPTKPRSKRTASLEAIEKLTPGKPTPNIWTVIQKWILALPTTTSAEKNRRDQLQIELEQLVKQFGNTTGIGGSKPFVFAHCDLLSGNVIIQPPSSSSSSRSSQSSGSDEPETPCTVSFIDYEYATPAPAAFDLANHFAEWGGLDCDFSVLPTRFQRRDFLKEYLLSYNSHLERSFKDVELNQLFDEVDRFRGVPGFYWGIWALIQAQISQIDFDYASYAEIRLGEFWAWKAEVDGSREKCAKEMPLREQRWAQDS